MSGIGWARRFADGLSSLRDRAAARLAGSRFNPSRCPVCSDRSTHRGDPANSFCDKHYRQYLATFQVRPPTQAALDRIRKSMRTP